MISKILHFNRFFCSFCEVINNSFNQTFSEKSNLTLVYNCQWVGDNRTEDFFLVIFRYVILHVTTPKSNYKLSLFPKKKRDRVEHTILNTCLQDHELYDLLISQQTKFNYFLYLLRTIKTATTITLVVITVTMIRSPITSPGTLNGSATEIMSPCKKCNN